MELMFRLKSAELYDITKSYHMKKMCILIHQNQKHRVKRKKTQCTIYKIQSSQVIEGLVRPTVAMFCIVLEVEHNILEHIKCSPSIRTQINTVSRFEN